jgi:hypothetical protein
MFAGHLQKDKYNCDDNGFSGRKKSEFNGFSFEKNVRSLSLNQE